jgi:hypothetical protein
MATARFGTLCDLCGAGSLDYAHDANPCDVCERDLCDTCALKTGHLLARDWDVDTAKLWSEEEKS